MVGPARVADQDYANPAPRNPLHTSACGFGSVPLPGSLDLFFSPMMMYLALAQSGNQIGISLAVETRGGDTAVGSDDGSAPVALAMTVPVPKPRPRIAESADADTAQLQVSMPQPHIIPIPRLAPSTVKKEEMHGAFAYANPDVANDE